jgi:polyhydroxyalkanoate synthase
MMLLSLQANPAQAFSMLQQKWPVLEAFTPPQGSDLQKFLQGLTRYRATPGGHEEAVAQEVARWGRVTLQHLGGEGEAVLLIPSMINKAYIFDLLPSCSFAQHLVQQGFAVYMLDWASPEAQNPLTMDRAVEIIVQAMMHLRSQGKPPHVVGYCMGGLMAVAAVLKAQDKAKSLACLAMPWDFTRTTLHGWCLMNQGWVTPNIEALPLIPIDILQTLFATLQPMTAIERLMAFATEDDPQQLERLAAIEDWLADGVPLERDIALHCFKDWYVANAPYQGTWQVAGQQVKAVDLKLPVFVLAPDRDVIVPKPAALAFAEQVPQAKVLEVPAGHIGIMVGRKAPESFFVPFTGWLKALQA